MSLSKRPGPVAILLLAVACTPRGEPARDVIVEPGPAPVVVESPVIPPAPPPSLAPVAEAQPGFVLYTEDRTFLVPIDGSPRVMGEGLWVLDDRAGNEVTHTLVMSRERAEIAKLPTCACLGDPGACELGSLESRRFDPQTGAIVETPKASCTCVALSESVGYPAQEVDGEFREACMTAADDAVVSLVAGRLESQGWDWNGACFDGYSVYDALSSSHELVDDPPELSDEGMRRVGCSDEGLDTPAVVRPWPIPNDFDECEDYHEADIFTLRRGYLWWVGYDISGVGGSRTFARRPVRADSCPTINDPCGDPEPFRTRAGLVRPKREFWIATDGSAALTAERDHYALWHADGETPIEFELAGVDATTDVIGVRVHADLRLLRERIEQHPGLGIDRAERSPRVVEPQACLERSGLECAEGISSRERGERCVMWMEIEEWTAAESACLCGLEVAGTPNARAALLYNLGKIAEVEGAWEQAAAYYAESDALRPDNGAARQELDELRSDALAAALERR